tara:strand:- start:382 stop:726 length:345 start_codon:yes stop_codon:yes gene_type:complete
MTDSPEIVWGSPPLVRPGERCPACGRLQIADHPIRLIIAAEVDEDLLEQVMDMLWEDDRGNVDWGRLWDGTSSSSGIDGHLGDDGRCWMLPPQMDDPVFEKIKRGVRALRRDEG